MSQRIRVATKCTAMGVVFLSFLLSGCLNGPRRTGAGLELPEHRDGPSSEIGVPARIDPFETLPVLIAVRAWEREVGIDLVAIDPETGEIHPIAILNEPAEDSLLF